MFTVLDIETSKAPHLKPWDIESFICSVGIEREDGTTKTWLFNHVSEPTCNFKEAVEEISEVVRNSSVLVAHNAKFDLCWLKHIGVPVDVQVWCTQIGDYILYGQNKNVALSLDACCKRRDIPGKKDLMSEFWAEGFETNEIPWDIHQEYLLNDCHITRVLYEEQRKNVEGAGLTKLVEYSSNVSKVLAEIEYNGVAFDKERALVIRQEYKDDAQELELLMHEYASKPFSPSSSTQLGSILFGGPLKREVKELIARPRKNGSYRVYDRKVVLVEEYPGIGVVPHPSTFNPKTGRYSTGKKARMLMECSSEYQRAFLRILDKWSNANKAWSTILNAEEDKGWLTKVQMDGRIHPTFNQCVTHTARMSSEDPNGQNIPRGGTSRLKQLFVPSLDYIVNVDLAQIEWRMAAALSEDEVMCSEISNGLDCHTENGEKFFGGNRNDHDFKKKVRQPCKVFNFRMIYNGSAKAFHFDPEMPKKSLPWWESTVNGFWEKYSTLRAWQKKNKRTVEKQRYLRNVTGRVLTFKYNTDPNEGPIGFNFNAICNYPVQSVSADLIFIVLLEVYDFIKRNNLNSRMILQVHDSLVFDCPKDEVHTVAKFTLEVMNNLPSLSNKYYGWTPCVPISGEASVGTTYGNTLLYTDGKPLEVTLETIDKINEVLK